MKIRLICTAALLVLAGCALTAKDDANIPRVTPALLARAGSGATRILLEHGRETYTRQCAACHAPEPIAKYTMPRWREIVADMADRSDLPPEPRAALLAYLGAATAGTR
jgi:mono/diheme cytochrome c family protein